MDGSTTMMMNLNQVSAGKKVKIVTIRDQVFEGIVDNSYPIKIADLVIKDCPKIPGQLVCFDEADIKSMEVIE